MRPSVDLPQPDSPTRPSDLAACDRERDVARPPARRASRPRRRGGRRCARRASGAARSASRRSSTVEEGALTPLPLGEDKRQMAVRRLRHAARRRRHVAGSGRSPRGQRGRERRSPGGGRASDGVEPGICAQVARPGSCSRRQRCRAGRGCRDGAAREHRAVGPSSTIRPAYMTAMRSASAETTARSCVIQISAVPSSRDEAAHLGEDLRLDRDVERGRRLVGDDHRRAGAAARWRSRRAGACRRRTGADRRRAGAPGSGMPTVASAVDRARPRGDLRETLLVRRERERASASAMVSTGFSVIIGSWNTIAMRAPADPAQRSPSAGRRAPGPRTGPSRATIRPGGSTSPRIEKPGDALAGARFADEPEHFARARRSKDTPSTAFTHAGLA